MKKALLIAALLIGLTAVRPDPASAQRATHVGGSGNVHVAVIGGGRNVHAAAIGGGRHVMLQFGWRGGWGGWGGWGARPGWGWGGGLGWRWPLAAGVAIASPGYYSYPYASYASYPYYSDPYYSEPYYGSYPGYSYASYDSCLEWNGYRWVNVCYQPYGYGYGY